MYYKNNSLDKLLICKGVFVIYDGLLFKEEGAFRGNKKSRGKGGSSRFYGIFNDYSYGLLFLVIRMILILSMI